jgi:hypothetical protein
MIHHNFTCLQCLKPGADFDVNGLKFCDERCAARWLADDENEQTDQSVGSEATPMNWVSVTDELPPDGRTCPARFIRDGEEMIGAKLFRGGRWWGGMRPFCEGDVVTHWQKVDEPLTDWDATTGGGAE